MVKIWLKPLQNVRNRWRQCLQQASVSCAVCFGDPQDLQTKAQNMAIITMLMILVVVLGGIGLWIRDLKNRMHQIKE